MIYIIITTSVNRKFGIQDDIHRTSRYKIINMCNQNFHLLIYVLNYRLSLTKNNLTKILNHHKLGSNIHHLL